MAPAETSAAGPGRRARILHVYRTGWPDTQGGTEEFIRTLCGTLPPERFENAVLYPSAQVRRSDEREIDGMQVCRVPLSFEIASCGVFLRGIPSFRRRAAWADVIHYHFPWPYADLLHLLAAPRPRKPSVLTYHSDIVRQRALGRAYAPLMRRFLSSIDCVVATSRDYARSSPVLRALRRAPEIIPLGIDNARLQPPGAEVLEAWRERAGQGFFLFVGVLRYYKGLPVLLRAVAGTDLRVVIAGEGPEGPGLRALARELGADNVLFAGRVTDEEKAALFRLCRAFVFPSNQRSEAYGIALLEALAWGRPAISTDIGTGVGLVNPAGLTGLQVPPDDPPALRAAMQQLAADDALCARLGAAGRARAQGELAAEPMAAAYAAIYAELYNPTGLQPRTAPC